MNATTNIEAEARIVSEIREIAEKVTGVADVRIDIDLITPRFL